MRNTVSFVSFSFIAALGLAACVYVPSAKAGGLVVGIEVPVAPVPLAVVPIAVAPPVPVTVVTDDGPTVIVDSGYCCSPAWRGPDWHNYGWRDYAWREGYRGNVRTTYEHPVYERRGYARPANVAGPRGHEAVRSGRR
jgi:hypothetical protein